jgi:catechol 2,3-dioxygenase-like lactoylglutathione lyase family enzyme
MKLKTTGIDHLNLQVKDLHETFNFYNELFGFEVKKEQPEDKSKIIGNNSVKLCLYETPGFEHYKKNGYAHFGLHIENFYDIMKKCDAMGLKVYYEGPVKWESSTSIYIKDPNGYEIELTEVFGGGLV